MSASLVGSEMCIRDRETAGNRLKQFPAASGSFQQPEGYWPLSVGLPDRCCLLYTSDAADDM
eukprot:1692575-Alexandrium_andersonii.AAC.1